MIKSMKKYLKKSLAIILAIAVILTTMSVGFLGFASEFNVTKTDNAVIVVPETVYMTPATGASTTGQLYVNNEVTSAGKVTTSATTTSSGLVKLYIPDAKSFTVSVTNQGGTSTGDITTSGVNEGTAYTITDGAYTNDSVKLNIASSGLNPSKSALAEWKFTVTMNDGSTRVYYAYSTLYAPYYQPVGAAAEAISSKTWLQDARQAWAGSILWVSGVHGYSASGYGDASAYYPRTSGFLPMLGVLSQPNNSRPSSSHIQNSASAPDPTVTYKEGEGSNHRRVNVVSPVANLTVDTSRYTNFNQIPNLKVGFIITDSENADSGKWYVADYTGHTTDVGNSTSGSGTKSDVGSSIYDRQGNGAFISGGDKDCNLKYNDVWNKAITSSLSD